MAPVEPCQVLLVTAAPLRFAFEERLCPGQHQSVRLPEPSGLMIERELGGVDPIVQRAPAVLGEWPL